MTKEVLDIYRTNGFGTYIVEDYARVINRKKYNTVTAEKVGSEWSFGVGSDSYLSLFRKKTGEFFSYVVEFRNYQAQGDTSVKPHCCGREIKPLTEDEAKDFCEKYFCLDTYEDLFGEVEE